MYFDLLNCKSIKILRSKITIVKKLKKKFTNSEILQIILQVGKKKECLPRKLGSIIKCMSSYEDVQEGIIIDYGNI